MARTIQQWIDEVVSPDPILGPIYRGEKTELGDIYTHYFWRNPKRPIIKENDVLGQVNFEYNGNIIKSIDLVYDSKIKKQEVSGL